MIRCVAVVLSTFALSGCVKPEQPIGYTPGSPKEPARADPAPTGGGGYEFGADLAKVRAKCSAERGKLEHTGKVSVCTSRHEDVGATRITLLEYCGGTVCRIHTLMVLDRPDAKSWLVPFDYLRRQLLDSYGAPDEQKSELPAECEAEFAACVRDGKATAKLRWMWEDGHAVMLRLGTTEQVPAAISVSYESALGGPSR